MFSVFALAVARPWGCEPSDLLLCGEIPEHGCPAGRGGTCDDPVCEGLYDCVEGNWQRVEVCSNAFGGGGAGGSPGGGGGQGGATGQVIQCDDLNPSEHVGCTPLLQEPDCPVEAASPCAQACTTGCEVFFRCMEKKAWEIAGDCVDGVLMSPSP